LTMNAVRAVGSKKKLCLVLDTPFYIGRRIRDEKMIEYGRKHPGSATLVRTISMKFNARKEVSKPPQIRVFGAANFRQKTLLPNGSELALNTSMSRQGLS
jgi:hypothetical protein